MPLTKKHRSMERVSKSGRCHVGILRSSRKGDKRVGAEQSSGSLPGKEVSLWRSGNLVSRFRRWHPGCQGLRWSYLCILGGCWGCDAGTTQAKVSSMLQLQRAGGCHMFSSRLLTWSRSLLAPLIMASRCVLGPLGETS